MYVQYAHNRNSRPACKAMFTIMVVAYNGDLMLCSLDYKTNHSIGNVIHEGFKAYSNKKFRRLRRQFIKDKKKIPICSKCENQFEKQVLL